MNIKNIFLIFTGALILWAIFFLNREEINKAEEMVARLTRKRYSPSQNLKPVAVPVSNPIKAN